MEHRNNISNSLSFTKFDWVWFEKQSTVIPVSLVNLISYINTLTSRYFFASSILYLDSSSDKLRNFTFRSDIFLSSRMVLLVSIHNRIMIMPEDTYKRIMHINHRREFEHMSLETYFPILDAKALHKPVIWNFDPHDTKHFFSISAHAILLHVHNEVYEIARNIFEMLYSESEDFSPSDSSDLIITTHVRHQLIWQGYHLTDLMKSDVAMVIDMQNRLRKEEKEILNKTSIMPNKKTILALHGIKGSGKDTLTAFIKMHLFAYEREMHHLQQYYFNSVYEQTLTNMDNQYWLCEELMMRIERFAKPLKAIIASFLGITEDDLNVQDIKKLELDPAVWYDACGTSLTIRDLHTHIADGIKKEINNDVFVGSCIDRINKDTHNVIFLVNDVRFPNELTAMQNAGAYCIMIQRQAAEEERQKSENVHASEKGLPASEFDYLISNDGSYSDLAIKTADMLADVGLVSNEYVKFIKRVLDN